MYSHWQAIPETGYEMLPDHFWCWGKAGAEHIVAARDNNLVQPKAMIGGHLWLAKWLDQEPAGLLIDADTQKQFLTRLNGYQKVVLITLQREDREVPAIMLEAIRKAPADWFWIIRVHPKQRDKVSLISDTLRDLHIDHAEVELASQLPLFYILKYTHRHLTQWSSVAVEALKFKVPSVIAHASGKMLYGDYIQAGHFVYAEGAEQIISALYEPTAGFIEDPPYVETNRMYALTALYELMQACDVAVRTRPTPGEPEQQDAEVVLAHTESPQELVLV